MKAKKILAIPGLLDNNCKIMARNLFNHKIVDTSKQIELIVEEFHQTLKDIYRGMYCTLCDADSHVFLDPEKKELKISLESCRELGNSSLQFLSYFHVNIIGVLNLSNFFVSTCNDKAAYNAKNVPKDFLFSINGEAGGKLLDAVEHRNDSNWMDFFTPICSDLKVGELTKFFMPYVKEFEDYTVYLKGVLAGPTVKKEVAGTENKETTEGTKPEENKVEESTQGRILVDNTVVEGTAEGEGAVNTNEGGDGGEEAVVEKEKPEVLTPYDQLKIYHKDNSKAVGIDVLRTVVEEDGVELVEVGRSVVIGGARALRGRGRRGSKRVKKGRRGRSLKRLKRKLRRKLKSGLRVVVGFVVGVVVALIV